MTSPAPRRHLCTCLALLVGVATVTGFCLAPAALSWAWTAGAKRDLASLGPLPVEEEDPGEDPLEPALHALQDVPEPVYDLVRVDPAALRQALEQPAGAVAGELYYVPPDAEAPADVVSALRLVAALLERVDPSLDAALRDPVPDQGDYARLSLALVIGLRANLRSFEGRPEEAWADVARMLQLARAGHDLSTDELNARHEALQGASRTLRHLLLRHGAPGPERRRMIAADLRGLDDPAALARATRVDLRRGLRRLARTPEPWLLGQAEDRPTGPRWLLRYRVPAWRADLVDLLARAIRVHEAGLPPRARMEALRALDDERDESALPVRWLTRPFVEPERLHVRLRVRLRLDAAALELAADRELPAAFDAGEDPFNPGRSLGYRCSAAGARLWSAGTDLFDYDFGGDEADLTFELPARR